MSWQPPWVAGSTSSRWRGPQGDRGADRCVARVERHLGNQLAIPYRLGEDATMPMSENLVVSRGRARLIGERWPGPDPAVVLLHAGVTDRRSWHAVAACLDGQATVISYDRRGFGETAPSTETFSHVEDLLAVLDEVTDGPRGWWEAPRAAESPSTPQSPHPSEWPAWC